MTPRDIRAARRRLGLTVRQFAQAVTDPARTAAGMGPVSARNVRYWEAGKKPVPPFVVDRIAWLVAMAN